VWQELNEELSPHGLVLLAVALDEDLDAVRQWARDEPPTPLTYPVLVDRDHVVAERYGIVNIPTTVWIDEQDRVVRPPSIAPADDTFRDFTHIDSSVHHAALRRWVLDGVAPLTDHEIRDRQTPPEPDVQLARTERRLAVHPQSLAVRPALGEGGRHAPHQRAGVGTTVKADQACYSTHGTTP